MILHCVIWYLLPVLLGAVMVGASTERVIDAYEGKRWNAAAMSLAGSITTWCSTSYITQGYVGSYFAFSIGAALVSFYLAHVHGLQRQRERQHNAHLDPTPPEAIDTTEDDTTEAVERPIVVGKHQL